MQNPAVHEIFDLIRGIDPAQRGEAELAAILAGDLHFDILTDEQRSQGAKAPRPCGVVLRKPLNFVLCLRVAPLRVCAALLVSGFLRTITMCKCGRIWV
jgi:hypothetical protein